MESDIYPAVIPLLENNLSGIFNGGTIICLSVILILLVVSGLISASEIAYFSLTDEHLTFLKNRKNRADKWVTEHLQAPDRLMATVIVTSNFLNIAIVILSTFVTLHFFFPFKAVWWVLLVQLAAISSMILVFSEIIPKIYARNHPLQIARFMSAGIQFFKKIFWPLSSLVLLSTRLASRRLAKITTNFSMNGLSGSFSVDGSEASDDEDILKGIVKFNNFDVCDIMRSRVDTVAIEINSSYSDLIRVINESGYSRIPVYEETFDHIRGILYVKDLLPFLNKSGGFNWQQLMRPPYFIPESKKINDLLKEFQSNRIHMAVVVDEYGGTSGIVTLEDILEEIVGEITDESDFEPLPYEKIDHNNYIFEGKILLNDLYKILGIDDNFFNDIKGDADTLAGLILELSGEIPQKDRTFSYGNLLFTIISVDKRRIKKIKVTIQQDK